MHSSLTEPPGSGSSERKRTAYCKRKKTRTTRAARSWRWKRDWPSPQGSPAHNQRHVPYPCFHHRANRDPAAARSDYSGLTGHQQHQEKVEKRWQGRCAAKNGMPPKSRPSCRSRSAACGTPTRTCPGTPEPVRPPSSSRACRSWEFRPNTAARTTRGYKKPRPRDGVRKGTRGDPRSTTSATPARVLAQHDSNRTQGGQ